MTTPLPPELAQVPPAPEHPPVPEHIIEPPTTRLDKTLARVPVALASKIHQLFLVGLGVWLIVFPLVPGLKSLAPSQFAELIGGNWTNVSSALGACIAAGASLAAHREARHQRKLTERAHAMIADLHVRHIGGPQ